MERTANNRLAAPAEKYVWVLAIGGSVLVALTFLNAPSALLLAASAAALVYFSFRPFHLLLAMAFLIPFNFVITVGPLPVAAEMLKAFAWIPFFIHLASRRLRLKTSKYDKWLAVLAILILVSIVRANDILFTLKDSVRFGSNIALVYLVINLVDTREKVFQIFRALVFSTFLVACYGFYQWAIQDYGTLFWIVNPRIETSLAPGRDAFWPWRDRITSTLTSEMELGHYFNLCLPIGVALWLGEGQRRFSSKWLFMVIAMLAGLLLTFTFGAWVSLAAATGCFVLFLGKKQRWKLLFGGLSILVIGSVVLVFSPLRSLLEAKIFGTGYGGLTWDIDSRLAAWRFAMRIWWSHPFLGAGIGNYQILTFEKNFSYAPWSTLGSTPHETYLYLLAALGIGGLVSTLIVMVGSIRSNLSLIPNPFVGLMGLALGFGLTTNMIGWFGDDSTFFGPHAGYLVWLLIGLSEAITTPTMTRTLTEGKQRGLACS